MTDLVLTLNAGSSSIKFGLYRPPGTVAEEPELEARGLVDALGVGPWLKVTSAEGEVLADRALPDGTGHVGGLEAAIAALGAPSDSVLAVGHRIAHGAPGFPRPVILDAAVLARLASYTPFAPSHQPHNLAAVRAAMKAFPTATQVGCFDTSFHQTKGFLQETYALPRELYHSGVRRYGHHGLSYEYIAGRLATVAPDVAHGKVVVAHLGNGASMCALSGGRSVETTMGFSALDGLPMGTRCGQLDPGILLYLLGPGRMELADVETILYRESGLKGLSGLTNDMRDLEAAGAREADEAISFFANAIRREIAAMGTTLGGLDAIVFCGGIGENSAEVRRRVLEPLGWLGVRLDAEANAAHATRISSPPSRIAVLVVPTDEEIVLARSCLSLIGGSLQPGGSPMLME